MAKEELADFLSGLQLQRFCTTSIPDYFEDENGQPLWIEELIEIMHGVDGPILSGRPRSVWRLGPSPLIHKEEWTVKTANTIAHFLDICKQLSVSRFLRDPLSAIQFLFGENPQGKEAYTFPDTEATRAGVLLCRQLYSRSRRDDAFRNASEAYERHAGDERKRCWVRYLREGFDAFMNETLRRHSLGSRSREQLLDLVLYGSGLVHSRSDKKLEPEFSAVLDEYGPAFVATAFHFCCRELCRYVFDASYPMMQDLPHWIRSEGCVPPDRRSAGHLFG